MLLRAPSGNVYVFGMMAGSAFGGPMQSMGGAEPGAKRL
jgi:hypothetical protein